MYERFVNLVSLDSKRSVIFPISDIVRIVTYKDDKCINLVAVRIYFTSEINDIIEIRGDNINSFYTELFNFLASSLRMKQFFVNF